MGALVYIIYDIILRQRTYGITSLFVISTIGLIMASASYFMFGL